MCILLKESLRYIEHEDIKALSVEYIIEICAIDVPEINVMLIVIYWLDSKRKVNIFYEQLEKLLQVVRKKY